MTAEQVAAGHLRLQASAAAAAVVQARRAWSTLNGNMLGAWRSDQLGETLYVAVSSLQWRAAAMADSYVDDVLAEQGIRAEPAGQLSSRMFAGRATDGRDLESLLIQPVIGASLALNRGAQRSSVMSAFGRRLERIAATQVQDAGRVAVGVAIASRPNVDGYTRMLAPPSCGRCAVLAGRFYRWSSGFLRHPMCDCRHIPTVEDMAGDLRTNPRAYFDSLTTEQQGQLFGVASAKAIRDGADVARTVNATGRTGSVYTAGGRKLTRGRANGQPRPTPEQIYVDAVNRDDAIRLLSRHGYIT